MYKTSVKSGKLDSIGSVLSIGCAIHCLIFPFLISFGSLATVGEHLHEQSESAFLLVTLSIAAWSLATSYSQHRSLRPIILVILSVCLILSAKIFVSHSFETVLNVCAAILIALAHQTNRYYARRSLATPDTLKG